MSNIIICILFLAFIGCREFFIYKERQKLCDRIQSGGLIEFKRFEKLPLKRSENEEQKKVHNWL